MPFEPETLTDDSSRLATTDRLFQLSIDLLCVADSSGRFTRVNPAFSATLGWTAEEMLARPYLDFMHPDDRAMYLSEAGDRATSAKGMVFRFECSDGSFRWLEWRWTAPDPDGLIYACARDVTEVREAADRVEHSEHRYRSFFQNHPEAVFSLDTLGRFTSANAACGELVGYDSKDVIGRTFDHLVAREKLDTALSQFRHVLDGNASTFQITLRHRTGCHIEVSITKIPMIVDGVVTEVFGIARDMTMQRELEMQLRQAQKMEAVGQLAAGVAHDFNNVISVIQGCAEFLRNNVPSSDRTRADVETICDAAGRAAAMTHQLLAFSRKQVLQPTILDLNGCVEDVRSMIQRTLPDNINVVSDLASDLGFVLADRAQLEQVIINMIINARDAMADGGELRITTSNVTLGEPEAPFVPQAPPGEFVRLTIADTGHGMDETTLSRLFEPFYTTKPKGKGTGLGLATAYGTIRQSSGQITVSSQRGQGTTFDIYLPLVNVAVHCDRSALTGDDSLLMVAERS